MFFLSGNWHAPAIDKAGPGKFGFFVFPPAAARRQYTDAMTAADTLVIPVKAPHPAQAAAFLNFIQTDPGRPRTPRLGGFVPAARPTRRAGSRARSAVGGTVDLLRSGHCQERAD